MFRCFRHAHPVLCDRYKECVDDCRHRTFFQFVTNCQKSAREHICLQDRVFSRAEQTCIYTQQYDVCDVRIYPIERLQEHDFDKAYMRLHVYPHYREILQASGFKFRPWTLDSKCPKQNSLDDNFPDYEAVPFECKFYIVCDNGYVSFYFFMISRIFFQY